MNIINLILSFYSLSIKHLHLYYENQPQINQNYCHVPLPHLNPLVPMTKTIIHHSTLSTRCWWSPWILFVFVSVCRISMMISNHQFSQYWNDILLALLQGSNLYIPYMKDSIFYVEIEDFRSKDLDWRSWTHVDCSSIYFDNFSSLLPGKAKFISQIVKIAHKIRNYLFNMNILSYHYLISFWAIWLYHIWSSLEVNKTWFQCILNLLQLWFQTVGRKATSKKATELSKHKFPEFNGNISIDSQIAYLFDKTCQYNIIFGVNFLDKFGFTMKYNENISPWMDHEISLKIPDKFINNVMFNDLNNRLCQNEEMTWLNEKFSITMLPEY